MTRKHTGNAAGRLPAAKEHCRSRRKPVAAEPPVQRSGAMDRVQRIEGYASLGHVIAGAVIECTGQPHGQAAGLPSSSGATELMLLPFVSRSIGGVAILRRGDLIIRAATACASCLGVTQLAAAHDRLGRAIACPDGASHAC